MTTEEGENPQKIASIGNRSRANKSCSLHAPHSTWLKSADFPTPATTDVTHSPCLTKSIIPLPKSNIYVPCNVVVIPKLSVLHLDSRSRANVYMASCNANVPEMAAGFHPTVWGDFFINYIPQPSQACLYYS